MKKFLFFMAPFLLCIFLFAACGVSPAPNDKGAVSPDPSRNTESQKGTDAAKPASGVTITCRVIEEEDGVLLLARQDGSANDVYCLTPDDALFSGEIQPEEGSLLEVTYSGAIQETFPAQLGSVSAIYVLDGGFDDMCQMYLSVLEDLWETDSALNSDITQIGIDLSGTRLPPAEQAAVAWAFGEEHSLSPLEGTWEELCDQGYIDKDALSWENGCFFSIRELETEGIHHLSPVTFDAEKWRSGDGAYFFLDCTSIQSASGAWADYQIGSEAIS